MRKMTFLYNYIYMNINFLKNNYTAVLGSKSGPGLDLDWTQGPGPILVQVQVWSLLDLDLRSRSGVCKKWPDRTWIRLWTVYQLLPHLVADLVKQRLRIAWQKVAKILSKFKSKYIPQWYVLPSTSHFSAYNFDSPQDPLLNVYCSRSQVNHLPNFLRNATYCSVTSFPLKPILFL